MTELAAHEFWQEIHSPGTFRSDGDVSASYIAELDDGRQLRLPVRVLADGQHALASLIINQASFQVLMSWLDRLPRNWSLSRWKLLPAYRPLA